MTDTKGMEKNMNLEAKTRIVSNLKTWEQREKIRVSKPYRDFWFNSKANFYNSIGNVGSLMSAINDLPLEATRKQWVQHYFTTVKTWDEIDALINKISQQNNMTYSTALNMWWSRCLDSSYAGWHSETTIFNILKIYSAERGYIARKANKHEDEDLGADVIILDQDYNIMFGIQTKDVKYFTSTAKNVTHARTVLNPMKYKKFTEAYGVPVFYCIIQDSIEAERPVFRKTLTLQA